MKHFLGSLLLALGLLALAPIGSAVVPTPTKVTMAVVSDAVSQEPPPLQLIYYRTPKRGRWCEDVCGAEERGPCCDLPA